MHRHSIEREFHANQLTTNTYSHFCLGRDTNSNFVAHSATIAIVTYSAINTYSDSFGLGRNVKTNFQPSASILPVWALGDIVAQIRSQNQCQSAHQSSKKLIHSYIFQINVLSLDLTLLKCHNQLL